LTTPYRCDYRWHADSIASSPVEFLKQNRDHRVFIHSESFYTIGVFDFLCAIQTAIPYLVNRNSIVGDRLFSTVLRAAAFASAYAKSLRWTGPPSPKRLWRDKLPAALWWTGRKTAALIPPLKSVSTYNGGERREVAGFQLAPYGCMKSESKKRKVPKSHPRLTTLLGNGIFKSLCDRLNALHERSQTIRKKPPAVVWLGKPVNWQANSPPNNAENISTRPW
jgi:hypothetical protein